MKSVLMKPSSGLCNMQCGYCFYCDEMNHREQKTFGYMSLETLQAIMKKTVLNADSPVAIAFQGGEPTLRGLEFYKHAVALEKKYNHKHVQITNAFQTNGILIDEDWCRFFHDNHFLIGLSVDGTQAIHDSLRHMQNGTPSFENVIKASKLMDQYEVDYNILTVVTSSVAENIQDIYHFYKSQGWKYQQYIPCLDSITGEHGGYPWSLTPEMYGHFLIQLFDLWYEDLQKKEQPFIRQFENYIGIALGMQPEACDQRGLCSIQYVVEADGSCYPCDFYMLEAMKLGNFNTDSYKSMDSKRDELGFIQRSAKISEQCRSCRYRNLCRVGCQRMRDYQIETDTYLNYYCAAYKLFFEKCRDRIYEIAKNISR